MTEHYNSSNNLELLFYDIMGYPVPKQREYFVCKDKADEEVIEKELGSSWLVSPRLQKEYMTYISKWGRLFKSLPFVKTIYLCNSITFNSIHEDSDIDIFIVTTNKGLRRARFWSVLLFRITGLKRSKKNKKQKFCLSFYVTENYQNLYNISLDKTDIYLAYWIAHLVPIYEETPGNANIYSHNTRIRAILPNIPIEQNIFLDVTCVSGKTKFKTILETLQRGRIGHIIETWIKTIWLPILIYKKNKLGEIGKDIIINNSMLKFYADKRKKIALLYKLKRDKLLSRKI